MADELFRILSGPTAGFRSEGALDIDQSKIVLGIPPLSTQGQAGDTHALVSDSNPHATKLTQLADVSTTPPTTGQMPQWNGSQFVFATGAGSVSWGAIGGTLTNQTDLDARFDTVEADIDTLETSVAGKAPSGAQYYVAAAHADLTAEITLVSPLVAADKGVANGVATLDGGTKIPVAQIPTGIPQANITNLTSDLAGKAAAAHTHGYADLPDVAASKLLGRGSAAGTGDIQEITIGNNLTLDGTTLNAAGGGSKKPIALFLPAGAFTNLDYTIAASTALVQASSQPAVSDFLDTANASTVDITAQVTGTITGAKFVVVASADGGTNWKFLDGETMGTNPPTNATTAGVIDGSVSGDVRISDIALHSSLKASSLIVKMRAYGDGTNTGTLSFRFGMVCVATTIVASSGVSSFNSRTGAVTPQSGDYTAAQVGAPSTSRSIITAGSLTGGGDLTTDRTLQLSGDAASPGNSKYYGTDGSGAKGFFALPSGGSGAPTDAQYYVAAAHAGLSNEVVLVSPLVAADKGAANGVASLDSGTKIPVAQIPTGIPQANVASLTTDLAAKAPNRLNVTTEITAATATIPATSGVVVLKNTALGTYTLPTPAAAGGPICILFKGSVNATVNPAASTAIEGGSVVFTGPHSVTDIQRLTLVPNPSIPTQWLRA